jgi:hypothetical protein
MTRQCCRGPHHKPTSLSVWWCPHFRSYGINQQLQNITKLTIHLLDLQSRSCTLRTGSNTAGRDTAVCLKWAGKQHRGGALVTYILLAPRCYVRFHPKPSLRNMHVICVPKHQPEYVFHFNCDVSGDKSVSIATRSLINHARKARFIKNMQISPHRHTAVYYFTYMRPIILLWAGNISAAKRKLTSLNTAHEGKRKNFFTHVVSTHAQRRLNNQTRTT